MIPRIIAKGIRLQETESSELFAGLWTRDSPEQGEAKEFVQNTVIYFRITSRPSVSRAGQTNGDWRIFGKLSSIN